MAGDPVFNLRFNVMRNAIYHGTRARFLNTLNRTLNLLIVAGGTGAVSDLGLYLSLPREMFAAFAAVSGLLQLVFDFSGRANLHTYLQKRYFELLAEIEEKTSHRKEDLAQWQAQLNRLAADEIPPMRALDAIAYNAACDATGKADRIKLEWYHTAFQHIWPFNSTKF